MNRERVWVVRDGDGTTVGAILEKAKIDVGAVTDGRVFVGKKRVGSPAHAVKTGDAVRIGPERQTEKERSVAILYDAKGLVAALKPAGLPTVPDLDGAAHSLVMLVEKQIGAKGLRITSRLDHDVSGVVIFARDQASEERLKAARARGDYRRRYVAIAGAVLEGSGEWDAPIGRAKNPRLRAANGLEAKESVTAWRAMATAGETTLLAVDPVTGRTHQIRVHASHAEAPLLGDRDYGGRTRVALAGGRILEPTRIALHAARILLPDVTIDAPVPDELRAIWRALGGTDDAWGSAVNA